MNRELLFSIVAMVVGPAAIAVGLWLDQIAMCWVGIIASLGGALLMATSNADFTAE